MNASEFRQRLRPWMLPIAMLLGIIFHDGIQTIGFLSPYLIFIMLLITYCKVSIHDFKVTPFIWSLLAVQIGLAAGVYFLLRPFSQEVAQSTFICIFCPTATAAPVVTGMLGGSVGLLATYSVFSNVAAALLAPWLFLWFGATGDISAIEIARKVFPLILSPLAVALLMKAFAPRVHDSIASHQSLSFYIWAVSLLIVVGNAVSFIMTEPATMIPEMLTMAAMALLVCLLQFGLGRIIGGRLGNKISGAQGLGQKNTVLAIWMALSYFNPVTSVGAAAYVGWQNALNSYQLYRKMRRERTSTHGESKTKP